LVRALLRLGIGFTHFRGLDRTHIDVDGCRIIYYAFVYPYCIEVSTDMFLDFLHITVLLTFKLRPTHPLIFYTVFGIQQLQFISCKMNQ